MGGQLSVNAPQASTIALEAYLSELGDVQYERAIGNARFMKTLKGMNVDGYVVIKVFIKPSQGLDLTRIEKELKRIKRCLATVGNAVAYSRIVQTDRAGYVVRQHLKSNLYDRISTRPFLENIEKVWITYQLLKGLSQCHQQSVYHGDIKSENVLVTSWNWVYLCDFAPFKPVYIPEDDPAYFSFYFDTSQRRCCYLAPERFLASGDKDQDKQRRGKLDEKMDIFSLGCVIAELFLEGTPTFTLAQLFKYKKGEYTPPIELIEDENIRSLVQSMLSLEPEERLTANEYLDQYRHKAFPDYFYTFLHDYLYRITSPITGQDLTIDRAKQIESDYRIDSIWDDFEAISNHLGFDYPESGAGVGGSEDEFEQYSHPVCLNLPGMGHWVPKLRKSSTTDVDDAALMVVAVVCTALRNTSRAQARVKGCDLLLALGERIHDEAKLDRCLPHLVALLDDPSENVQVAALRSLTHLLELVGAITPVNGNIFPEYILPRLYALLGRESVVVRSTYASCLSSLSQTASRFLDMGQVLKTAGMLEEQDPETENGVSQEITAFDTLKQNLSMMIQDHAIAILTDPASAVRRSLLQNIVPLCLFFGKSKTNDIVLSHLITYMNDKDPFLRTDFFEAVVALSPYSGTMSLEQYILPLMIQALTDPCEYVVEKLIQCFASLTDLGAIRQARSWELLKITAKFLIHPNAWIRNGTVALFASTTKTMTPAQVYCIFLPILRPYLECDINDMSETSILNNLLPPFSRSVYNRTLQWASKAQKSLFWRMDKSYRRMRTNRSSEDDQWISRLKEIGLREEDMWMLNEYKDYIYKVARVNNGAIMEKEEQEGAIKIQSIGVLPKNVFFDAEPSSTTAKKVVPRIVKNSTQTTQSTQPIRVPSSSSRVSPPESISSAMHSPSPNALIEPTRLLGLYDDENEGTATPNSFKSSSPGYMAQPLAGAVTTTDVYGEVGNGSVGLRREGTPLYRQSSSETPSEQQPHKPHQEVHDHRSIRNTSSYAGDDPYIWKLLENMYTESMASEDPPQLGPKCTPYTRLSAATAAARQQDGGSTGTGGIAPKRRRGKPLGVLVSSFEEHHGAINCVVVSPDHLFFITGGQDGLVKVWDCYRLEKNVINKSVQTLDLGSPVNHLTFIDNTYTVACALGNGVIKLIRVEMSSRTESLGPRYKKLAIVSEHQLVNESAMWMEYIKTDNASLLYLATTRCRLIAINVKSMAIVESLSNPFAHGFPTCFVVDRRKNWLLLGTSRGILDLWDLRFGINVKCWGVPGGSPINRISLHPRSDKYVVISGGTANSDITVWDIETTQCREVYRSFNSSSNDDITASSSSTYAPQQVDSLDGDVDLASVADEPHEPKPQVLALLTGVEFEQGPTTGRRGFIISAGSDRIVRFWDLHTGESSSVVSGLRADQGRTAYVTQHPDHSTKLISERLVAPSTKSGKPAAKPERLPRSTVISADQLDLGRNHSATVLDVALLLRPYEMVITVDRAGVIKVFL